MNPDVVIVLGLLFQTRRSPEPPRREHHQRTIVQAPAFRAALSSSGLPVPSVETNLPPSVAAQVCSASVLSAVGWALSVANISNSGLGCVGAGVPIRLASNRRIPKRDINGSVVQINRRLAGDIRLNADSIKAGSCWSG